MAKLISFLTFLVSFGILAADPTETPCLDEVQFDKNMGIYQTECQEQIKNFDNAPGPVQTKYKEFTVTWTQIANLTRSFIVTNFPEKCVDKAALASGFGNLMRFLQAKSELTKKEFLTAADPRILKKIADKSTKLDACYENSRNLTGVNLDDTSINFCSYNMDEAVDCAKKLFEDDDDEPLLALVSFTNYFVTEFDCKNPERDAFKYALVMKMYDRIGGTNKRPDRQTFYQGYQQAVDQFTKF